MLDGFFPRLVCEHVGILLAYVHAIVQELVVIHIRLDCPSEYFRCNGTLHPEYGSAFWQFEVEDAGRGFLHRRRILRVPDTRDYDHQLEWDTDQFLIRIAFYRAETSLPVQYIIVHDNPSTILRTPFASYPSPASRLGPLHPTCP